MRNINLVEYKQFSIYNNYISELKNRDVIIDCDSSSSYGRTNVDLQNILNKEANVNVAVDIDVDKYWDLVEASIRHFDNLK